MRFLFLSSEAVELGVQSMFNFLATPTPRQYAQIYPLKLRTVAEKGRVRVHETIHWGKGGMDAY